MQTRISGGWLFFGGVMVLTFLLDHSGGAMTGIVFACLCMVMGPIWAMRVVQRSRERRRLRALEVAQVDDMSGPAFERYVAALLEDRGFSRVEVTPVSGDYGADVVCRKNGRSYAVQVKRASKSVGRSAVSDAVAARPHYGCTDAMVVTNSWFTPGARTLAESTGCELVDRERLAAWIQHFQGKGASTH